MSYISRTGNLVATPELYRDATTQRAYCYARVAVSDRVRVDDGEWIDGPTLFYNVAVNGSEAENLVAAAKAGGNIRVIFAGRYRVTEHETPQGTRWNHEVRDAEIGVSLRGQTVTTNRGGNDAVPPPATSAVE